MKAFKISLHRTPLRAQQYGLVKGKEFYLKNQSTGFPLAFSSSVSLGSSVPDGYDPMAEKKGPPCSNEFISSKSDR